MITRRQAFNDRTRQVRCKKCGVPFEMNSALADRLLAANSPNCPRCPECELNARRQAARTVRAYHLFLRRCDEVHRRQELLRFSSTR
jgi:hypothetical protein